MAAAGVSFGTVTSFAPMRDEDLDEVARIERTLFDFPWTRVNFADSLGAGYCCRVMWQGRSMAGYAVMMCVLDEAHLLNLSVAREYQCHGLGRRLLAHLGREAMNHGAARMFLEVRPSNAAARALYERTGFQPIGRRPRYYPALDGREDAIVMSAELDDTWMQ
ncbi:MAG: ribosomal protein S18-alanine N-acetyltransferase [Methyloversatilis discipulorum]|jgi:ribosomal-protein-alanine N-acetyltransferase|uniref:ribosomal protein S18-alanine N-acetyltransferase n=1 Tax=Methyloversatilis discipulorum TaxID=1119528 RepID=UPI0026F17D5E|nr:ribosomal protein S18-alanine N-acetyltransferase [Methyloversatilis discipulorum]MBV5284888.1 ribosomal protein S18-alanine N-acetyltransferase [Methyloversatilis discipulorum]